MEELSLLHPQNSNAKYHTLTKEAINDLSIDFLCESLTKEPYERNSIKNLLINITDDEEVIKYRGDVFDDFLRYPQLRSDLTDLLEKLNDLREIERFQKDSEASSLWQMVNRLREMDGYVDERFDLHVALRVGMQTERSGTGRDLYVFRVFDTVKRS